MSFWTSKPDATSQAMAHRILGSLDPERASGSMTGTGAQGDRGASGASGADRHDAIVALVDAPTRAAARDVGADVPGDASSTADFSLAQVDSHAALAGAQPDASAEALQAFRAALEHAAAEEAAKSARIAELQREIEELTARRDEITALALSLHQYLDGEADSRVA